MGFYVLKRFGFETLVIPLFFKYMTTRDDIRWLQQLYHFLQDINDEDDVTIGTDEDRLMVRVGPLRRGIKTLFMLIQGVEKLRSILPADLYYL